MEVLNYICVHISILKDWSMSKTSKDKIIGIVERIIFNNQENGYYILSVSVPNEKDNVVVNAYHPTIHEGLTYEFVGEWTQHPTYGKQMKAGSVFESTPNTKEGLKAYLTSSFFPGIGPVIANRIIKHFKDSVIQVFNEEIHRLTEVSGISPKKLDVIKKSWEENGEINEVMMFLSQFGITTAYAAKIYKHYGKDCVNQIKENPYQLSTDIKGIGFKYADKIALESGIKPESDDRLNACIKHVLEASSHNGHCYLFETQIESSCTELLSVDVKDRIGGALRKMNRDSEIMTSSFDGGETRYYSKKNYFSESRCASAIGKLIDKHVDEISTDALLKGYRGVELSEEQMAGVHGIITKGVSILTGGPGTGKSTMTKAVVHALTSLNKVISLASPTGKASQRLTEVVGMQASTVHRLLGWDPIVMGFVHNESNPLDCEFLIIDESSMLDIHLASSILRAVPDDCQVLFIGDKDQLPPVGPGSFFEDLIDSGVVPTFRLTQIFRQGKESQIISYAHKINSGEHPEIESPLTKPAIWKDGSDCMFIDSGLKQNGKIPQDYPKWSSLRYGMDMVEMVKNLYVDTIKKYHKLEDVQILIPMRIGDVGTIRINEIIQEAVNPKSKNKNEVKLRDKIFRVNDKIINIRNNYELDVFNGDIGTIISIDPISGSSDIKFGENKIVRYKKIDLIDIELSYGITIHKSQGSEFQAVIIPVMHQYSRMLYRNLLYTGLTRAKKLCVFVGQRHAFNGAIDNIDPRTRQTSLKELLINADVMNSLKHQ